MDDSFNSPVKRSHHHYDCEPIDSNTRQKRHHSSRDGPSTPRFFADEVVFRILCPTSKTGSVIGKGGGIVKAIRHDTGARITVSDTVPGAEERVIIISAQDRNLEKCSVSGEENDANGKDIDAIDSAHQGKGGNRKLENGGAMFNFVASPAQEALFRVHTRIVDDERENDSVTDDEWGTASITTRLLVPSNQVGCLLGRGGKIIEQMREESGAQIRILPRDQLPVCALVTDEVVQVFGEATAVRNALEVISSRLQENPPRDRYQNSFNSSPKQSHPFHGQGGPRSPPGFSSGSGAEPGGRNFRFSSRPSFPTLLAVGRESMPVEEELSFRILCPLDSIGSIIGRGGSIIQNLREETGAKIKVEELVPGADERVVVVSSAEDVEDNLSPAQEAVFHIQDRIKDIGPNQDGIVTTRLLVPANQVGCLLGKGGGIIAEMRRSSKASIRILGREHLPKCAREMDEIVQIVGDIHVARDALVQITSRLRANSYRDKVSPAAAAGQMPSFGNDRFTSGYCGIREPGSPGKVPSSVLGHGLPNGHGPGFRNGDSSPDSWTLQRGREREFFPYEGPPQQGSTGGFGRFPGGIVTNTTVEVIIPSEAVTSVLGRNGSNIAQIRQRSGAKVELHDVGDDASESVVEISGTPDQTHAAQRLLQAFILSGQS